MDSKESVWSLMKPYLATF